MKRAVVTAIALAASLLGFGAMAQAASLVASIDVSRQTMTVSRYGQVIQSLRV